MVRFLVLLIAMACQVCYADHRSCKPYRQAIQAVNQLNGWKTSQWRCDGHFDKYRLKYSTALPLVAVWRYEEDGGLVIGDFVFVGEARLSGTVTRLETESLGDTVTFDADAASVSLLPSVAGELDFRMFGNGTQAAVDAFAIPALSEKNQCWSAPAKVVVKKLYVYASYGSDADGTFPIEYSVVKVGRFRKCQ